MSIASFLGLSSKTNKADGENESAQGAGELLPELKLNMSDEDLLKFVKECEDNWNGSKVKTEWERMCKENEDYWLNKQFNGSFDPENRPLTDNLIFESFETFLPQATRRNPEPVIAPAKRQPTPGETEYAKNMQELAANWADEIKLRLKIKRMARHWGLYLIGVIEMGWNLSTDKPSATVLRPKRLVFDPDGFIDEDGYHGRFVGVDQTDSASVLIKKFPKAKADITKEVNGKMSTNVKYRKWMTPEYTCFIMKKVVLDKYKNPYWNYDQEEPQQPLVDEFGIETPQPPKLVEGKNHLPEPAIPLVFLTVFNLGKQPVDETNLIQQNLPQQDLINKRLRQIDKNADKMNGGQVISGEQTGLNKEEAAVATEAINNGGTVYIPQGNAQTAIGKVQAQALPADVFNQLTDTRTRLLQIFGTQGLSSQGMGQEKTVRGKIVTKSLDTDRIGGGVTEYLEQVADDVYNWFIQLLFVFRPDMIADKVDLSVSVKEGSMLPKDDVSKAQQAIDLAVAGKLSLLDLYKRLDDPNPEQTAANVWLEVNAPQILYKDDPRIQEAIMGIQQQQMQQQQQQMMTDQNKQQADQQHQQQMQGQQMQGQMQMKQMDNEAKMAQLDKKQQGDLLRQVPVQ